MGEVLSLLSEMLLVGVVTEPSLEMEMAQTASNFTATSKPWLIATMYILMLNAGELAS